MFSLVIKFLAVSPRDRGVGDHLFWAIRVDKTLPLRPRATGFMGGQYDFIVRAFLCEVMALKKQSHLPFIDLLPCDLTVGFSHFNLS